MVSTLLENALNLCIFTHAFYLKGGFLLVDSKLEFDQEELIKKC